MLKTIGRLLLKSNIGLVVYEEGQLIYSNEAELAIEYIANPQNKTLKVEKQEGLGKVLYLITTDREQELYQSLRTLIKDSGNILYKADIEGNPLDAIIHSDDGQVLKEAASEVLSTDITRVNLKYRLLDGDNWKWYSNSLKGHRKKGILGFGGDLSAVIAHSRRMRKLQTILDSLFSHCPIQIYLIDISGMVYIWEGKNWFLKDDILGLDYREALKEYPHIIASLTKAFEGEETEWKLEYGEMHLESKVNPIYQDGKISGVIGVISDHTEIVNRAEELKQFVYMASHDLQEPVRLIHNYLQLLEHYYKDNTDTKVRKYIDSILKSANRLKSLIEDLLSYSRVASKLDIKNVSLRQVTQEALSNLEVIIKEKGAVVSYPNYSLHVKADGIHMLQLIQNLVHNALKFSDNPKVTIDWNKEGAWVYIKIKDNGVGISEEFHEYIFKPFKRLNNDVAGTGMGLSICKKVVELNGGSIKVESQPNEGSTFIVRLREAI